LFLPERIRISYSCNMAKNPKDMELKDFDTKWFVGVSFNNFTHPILKGVKIN